MSDPIGPGDWVECVEFDGAEGDPAATDGGPLFVRGEVYCVDAVGIDGGGYPWLTCAHMVKPLDCDGWDAAAFRPVYRRRDAESLTAKLLVGALSGVPAQVVRERSRETIKAEPDQ